MIYNEYLNTSFVNEAYWNATGCERLFLIKADLLSGYSMSNFQITELAFTEAFNLFDNLEGLQYAVKSETSKAGTLYQVDLSFSVASVNGFTTDLLAKLLNTPLTAVVEDQNGRFHMLGYRQGLEGILEFSSEEAAYTVKLNTKQLTKPLEVAKETVKSLALAPTAENTVPAPDFIEVVRPETGGSGGGSGNVLETVTVSTNNYQLSNNAGVVFITGAYTVLLPTNPQNGQEHIFKALYDAGTAPVIIMSNSASIDGNSSVQINSDKGSFSLIYSSGTGSWGVTSFAV